MKKDTCKPATIFMRIFYILAILTIFNTGFDSMVTSKYIQATRDLYSHIQMWFVVFFALCVTVRCKNENWIKISLSLLSCYSISFLVFIHNFNLLASPPSVPLIQHTHPSPMFLPCFLAIDTLLSKKYHLHIATVLSAFMVFYMAFLISVNMLSIKYYYNYLFILFIINVLILAMNKTLKTYKKEDYNLTATIIFIFTAIYYFSLPI